MCWLLPHAGPRWPVPTAAGSPGARARPHLQEEVVFEDPLHGDHQQVLKLKLPILDLQRAFLATGEQQGMKTPARDAGPQRFHPAAEAVGRGGPQP